MHACTRATRSTPNARFVTEVSSELNSFRSDEKKVSFKFMHYFVRSGQRSPGYKMQSTRISQTGRDNSLLLSIVIALFFFPLSNHVSTRVLRFCDLNSIVNNSFDSRGIGTAVSQPARDTQGACNSRRRTIFLYLDAGLGAVYPSI